MRDFLTHSKCKNKITGKNPTKKESETWSQKKKKHYDLNENRSAAVEHNKKN